MKVAVIHDWLTGLRGGERCLQAFLSIYPEADIYTLLHVPGSTDALIDSRVKGTSFIQKLPGARRYYRALLPFFPLAIRKFDLRGYDLVISLSHAAAKNVRIPKGTLHICYCFTPMRYIWDQAYSYFGRLTPLLWPVIKFLRRWDYTHSRGVDHFVAISRFISGRIRCFYGRPSEVIYPPVDSSWIRPLEEYTPGVAFLYAGALVPYKKPGLVVEAFNRLGVPLWIVGKGPEEKRLRKMAGPNISFLGALSDQELGDVYRRCRALIFPGTEDFGIVPVECMAAGRPVIGIYDGALKESLNALKPWNNYHLDTTQASGVFIQKNTPGELQSLIDSIDYFISREAEFSPEACRRQAGKFSKENFFKSWTAFTERLGLKDRQAVTETQETLKHHA